MPSKPGLVSRRPFGLNLLTQLSAIFVATALTIAVAAQLGLALCTDRLAVHADVICGGRFLRTLPAPGSGTLPIASGFEICPLVLVLAVLAAVLFGGAFLALSRDRHAGLRMRLLLRSLGSLPVPATAVVLTAAAVGPLALVRATSPVSFGVVAVAMLVAITFAVSLAATVVLTVGSRALVRLAQRAVFRFLTAFALFEADAFRPLVPRTRAVLAPVAAGVFSCGRGLRAPPIH